MWLCYYINGDNKMKKTLILGVVFILLGAIIGSNIRKYNYDSVKEIIKKDEKFYFLQEGVYEKEENLEKNNWI